MPDLFLFFPELFRLLQKIKSNKMPAQIFNQLMIIVKYWIVSCFFDNGRIKPAHEFRKRISITAYLAYAVVNWHQFWLFGEPSTAESRNSSRETGEPESESGRDF